jgi:hypothetical protein
VNKILWIFVLMFLPFTVLAETKTLADEKMILLQNLQKDGYLTESGMNEAANKYIKEEDKNYLVHDRDLQSVSVSQGLSQEENSGWTQYLSLINFIKVFAIILLLIAFSGIIKKLIRIGWFLIAMVPVWAYQAIFLGATIYASLFPATIWASQFFYIALFGIFGNLLVIIWILAIWKKLQDLIKELLDFGLLAGSVISFLLLIYFGAFAILYQSSFLGFFAAVALSGVFSFSLFYTPGVLFLYFKENALIAMVFGHLLALTIFVYLLLSGIAAEYVAYFNAGIQYYCTLALGIALLAGSSPFYEKSKLFCFLLLIGLCVLATPLYFMFNITVLPVILYIFFVLVLIEWIGYWGFKSGVIVGLMSIGVILFGLAMFLEKYASIIIRVLKEGI